TSHHTVLDGWSLPIVLQEIFAGYGGQRLPAAVPYRRFVAWLAGRDVDAARAAWLAVLDGFDTPTLVGAPHRMASEKRGLEALGLPDHTRKELAEIAPTHHTAVNTVLQGAGADLLPWLTGQRDVAFGAA